LQKHYGVKKLAIKREARITPYSSTNSINAANNNNGTTHVQINLYVSDAHTKTLKK
jgi:hypothetical protein